MTVKGKHGGARPGAGKKARVYSEFLKKQIVQAMRKKALADGRTFGDVLVDIVYNDDKSLINLRTQAARIIVEALLVKSSETQVSGYVAHGPTIGLPPVMAQPAEEEEEHPIHG